MESEMEDKKLYDETVRQDEERYRSILDTMEDGYFEVDLSGNMIFCNRAVARYVRLYAVRVDRQE